MNARIEEIATWNDCPRRIAPQDRAVQFADGIADVVHDCSAMIGAVAGVVVAALICQMFLAGRGVGFAGLIGIVVGCGLMSAFAMLVLAPAWSVLLAPFGPRSREEHFEN